METMYSSRACAWLWSRKLSEREEAPEAAREGFRVMMAEDPELAVAWDRDVPQELVTEPSLYCLIYDPAGGGRLRTLVVQLTEGASVRYLRWRPDDVTWAVLRPDGSWLPVRFNDPRMTWWGFADYEAGMPTMRFIEHSAEVS